MPTGPARQPAHDQSEGQEGGARERRRIALDPNEVEGQEEQDAAQCEVEQQGHRVGAAEDRGPEQAERHHGGWCTRLVPDEKGEYEPALEQDTGNAGVHPTEMKKIARQDRASTSQPPRTGPTAVVRAEKPAQGPIALPRSSSGKAALIIARLP